MLLQVRHTTQYRYAERVRESVMELWMQPQKSSRQRLISFDLSVDPVAQLFSYIDVYGNAVHHFDVPEPHDILTISAVATVETSDQSSLLDVAIDTHEWDRMKSMSVLDESYDFLQPYGFAVETDLLRAFIAEKGIDKLRRLDPLTAVRTLSEILYTAFAYEPGVTESDSPIDLALQSRSGVCQDFAHIMIAICRGWGMPARYVSGYLFTDRAMRTANHDRSSPDATHAWVEVFLPSMRWVGFDPTNNTVAGERHIAVAIGRDYDDVPPSRGVYKGDTESDLFVSVSVGKARAAMVEPELMRRGITSNPDARRREVNLLREQIQQQQ